MVEHILEYFLAVGEVLGCCSPLGADPGLDPAEHMLGQKSAGVVPAPAVGKERTVMAVPLAPDCIVAGEDPVVEETGEVHSHIAGRSDILEWPGIVVGTERMPGCCTLRLTAPSSFHMLL